VTALAYQRVPLRIRLPGQDRNFRPIGPSKRTSRSCLIARFDSYGVVRLGSAKPIAPLLLADVRECSRIDQDLVISQANYYIQRIGMAVTGAPGTERAGVKNHLITARRHHRYAGI